MPRPAKIVFAPICSDSAATSPSRWAAARDSSEAPAFNTSAQAVPSGYFNWPCWATIRARRNGIIIRMPRSPPSIATSITRVTSRSSPRIMIAGIVTPTPKAIDSPAEPAVCTMLFSRIVASFNPTFERMRNTVIEITATGIEALTVKPTFKTKYSEDAPNTIPSSVPMISGNIVNSRSFTDAGIYGRKLARNGFAGLALTLSLDISSNLQRVWQNGESADKTGLLYTRALSEGKHIAGEQATG